MVQRPRMYTGWGQIVCWCGDRFWFMANYIAHCRAFHGQ